jgi:WD40 repeat protein
MDLAGEKYHGTLASYFEAKPLYNGQDSKRLPDRRKMVELVWQLLKVGNAEKATFALCDVSFIEARARAALLAIQQEEYLDAMSLSRKTVYGECLNDFYWAFMHEQHIFGRVPELCFQQIYNQLQWKKGITKKLIDHAKEKFLSGAGIFLHQYIQPGYSRSNLVMTLSDHGSEIRYCSWSEDGKLIITGGTNVALKAWDAVSGKLTGTVNLSVRDWEQNYEFWVSCWAISPDGNHIATGSTDGSFKIWDAKTGSEIESKDNSVILISSCGFSPDGSKIIIAGWDSMELWDITGKRPLWKTKLPRNTHNSCQFSPDGNRVISGYSNSIKIRDSLTGTPLLTLSGHKGVITACSYSPDGRYIISLSSDSLILWDAETGAEIRRDQGDFGYSTFCVFSSDNQKVGFEGAENTIRIWDLGSNEEILNLQGHSGQVNCIAFSPDNKRLISVSDDKTLKIWDLGSSIEQSEFKAHEGPVSICLFSDGGDMAVSSGSWDRTVKTWCTKTGKELNSFIGNKLGRITSCTFSQDGRRIASAHGKILELWDVAGGKKLLSIKPHGEMVTSCAFSPDGEKLVSGHFDGTFRTWNSRTGEQLVSVKAYEHDVTLCGFSPDGDHILTKSYEHVIWIWSAESGDPLIIINGHGFIFFLKELFPENKSFSAGRRKTLEIIDWKNLSRILTLFTANHTYTSSCIVSYNSEAGFTNCLNITDSASSEKIADFYTLGFCNTFSVSPDGAVIACGDNLGGFYLLRPTGFKLGMPVDRIEILFGLISNYRSKIIQGGWQDLARTEYLWNEEFEEERYVIEMSDGLWKEDPNEQPF